MSDERARLPGFDANGNLPPGVYRVSLDDIEAFFRKDADGNRKGILLIELEQEQ